MNDSKKNSEMNGWILISVIFLLLLLTIFAGRFFKSENKLNLLFENNQTMSAVISIYDDHNKIISSFVLFFNPGTNRFSGVYMLPETYLSFSKGGRSTFMTLANALSNNVSKEEIKNGISRLLGTKINYYLFINEDNFKKYIDLIGFVEIYTPEISIPDSDIYYPSGHINLDGEKALEYLTIQAPGENEYEKLRRTETFTKSFLQLNETFIDLPYELIISDYLHNYFKTNLSLNDFLIFYRQIKNRYTNGVTDFSKYFLGTLIFSDKDTRDGEVIHLPKQSGNWIRSQVKDNLDKLTRQELQDIGNRISVQILNGTEIVGFANRTRHYIESFGFEVTEVSNADHQDYRETVIVVQQSEEKSLKLAELIRCRNIVKNEFDLPLNFDVTIILGKDFDGRVVK